MKRVLQLLYHFCVLTLRAVAILVFNIFLVYSLFYDGWNEITLILLLVSFTILSPSQLRKLRASWQALQRIYKNQSEEVPNPQVIPKNEMPKLGPADLVIHFFSAAIGLLIMLGTGLCGLFFSAVYFLDGHNPRAAIGAFVISAPFFLGGSALFWRAVRAIRES